jgi:uncharacterized phage protein gp47/JayE
MYIEIEEILNEGFADTASRQYLIKRAAERGVTPEPASHCISKGEFNIDVPIGSRYSLDDLNYIVTEKISTGVFKLQCETIGTKANSYLGTLIPIDYIDGLTSAELTEILIPGEDEEETEHLRERYFRSLDSQSYGGNVADYKEKTNAIPGVGGVKVYPVWNGGGTVKLVIINSEYQKPSAELVDQVQTIIDPVTNQGQGLGVAPIGHVVTVEGVSETIVNISTTITYQNDYTWNDIKQYVENIIDEYFKELIKIWEDEENLIVRISQIETRFLNIIGVIDISDTKINNLAQNLIVNSNNIPVRGVIVG